MAWLYVPGLGVSNSASTSPSPGIALWVTLSGKQVLRPPSWHGWRRRSWTRLLSGTTLPPSTAAHGVASWISSLRDTHASRSALPDGGGEPQTLATSGPMSPGLPANAEPPTSSWRTSPIIFVRDSVRFTMTWEQWVSALQLNCSRRLKSARDTSASASSSWPTARAADSQGSSYQRDRGRKGAERPTLLGAAMMWPTPRAAEAEHLGWVAITGRKDENSLTQAANLWPTVTARDYRAPNSKASQNKRNAGTNRGHQLPNFLEHHFSLPQAPATDDGAISSPNSHTSHRRLNPIFVEWLMGWPIGWTACGRSETGFVPWLRHSRSALSTLRYVPQVEPAAQIDLFAAE